MNLSFERMIRSVYEFGSLLRIHYPERHPPIGCVQPVDVEAYDLALHLIATHHGAGRPHFGEAVYADFNDVERDAIHTDSIRRFARLQRKYGWWHLAWLENLLRCADAMASASSGNALRLVTSLKKPNCVTRQKKTLRGSAHFIHVLAEA